MWRSVRAPIIARSGDLSSAVEMARAAVVLAQQTEIPVLQADALAELAQVLGFTGEQEESLDAMGLAITLYTAKGDIVSGSRSQRWLDERRGAQRHQE